MFRAVAAETSSFVVGFTVAVTAKAARHRNGMSSLHDCPALGIFRPPLDVWRIPFVRGCGGGGGDGDDDDDDR